MAFFSVLVPVYNEETYLSECIESILAQDFTDYEIVLVDDGSKDRSAEICDEYSNKYETVKVIHKKNEGLLFARKTGIENADGKYLLFLDSDDTFRQDTLSCLKKCIDKHGCDLILFNASTNSSYEDSFLNIDFENEQTFVNESKKEIYITLCSSHKLNNLCFKCVKRDLIDLKNYQCPVNINYGEDLFQSVPIFHKATKITYLNENLYYYRQRSTSMTHLYSEEQLESVYAVFGRLTEYAKIWSENSDFDYLSLTKRYAGQECYSITKNIISSAVSFEKKNKNLKQWYNSSFYREHKKNAYTEISGARKMIYFAVGCKCRPINWCIHKAFSMKRACK